MTCSIACRRGREGRPEVRRRRWASASERLRRFPARLDKQRGQGDALGQVRRMGRSRGGVLLADVGIERGSLQGQRGFGERFLRPRSVSGGGAKGRCGRHPGGFYRRPWLGGKARVRTDWSTAGGGGVQRLESGEGKVMTGGPGRSAAGGVLMGGPDVSARGERGSGYPFGFCPGWAVDLISSWAG
jgi:hypothetical protein